MSGDLERRAHQLNQLTDRRNAIERALKAVTLETPLYQIRELKRAHADLSRRISAMVARLK